jgi:putative ABC transport system permease protein
MVFPAGVFEGAPQTNLFFVESSGDEMMDRMQHKVTETFPNVSALDFRELLETIEGLVRQAVLAVSALAGLTAVTGFLILLAVLSSSRFQRQRECVLLASLGATRAVLFRILLVEFMVLGGVATLAGLVLAVGGAWAVTYFWIDLPFGVPWGMLVAMGVLVPILTSLGGWWSSRGLMSLPPIKALRSASGHGD